MTSKKSLDITCVTENFDPTPIRRFLGLDQAKAIELPQIERERLANMLLRYGGITRQEIKEMGGRIERSK